MKNKKNMKAVPITPTDTRISYAIYFIYLVLFIGALFTYLTPGFMGSFTVHGKKSEADARREYGDVAMRHGDFRAALEQYRVALDLQPDYMAARVNLGTAYFKLGMFGEAAATYEEALTKNPEQPDVVYFYLAQISERVGRHADALQHYKSAAMAAPFPFGMWKRVGALFFSDSLWDSSIVYMNKALDNRLTLGQKYMGMLKRDMNKYPDDPSVKPIMQKRLLEGIHAGLYAKYDSTVFLSAMKRDPMLAEVHDIIGYAYFMTKNIKEAKTHFQLALDINPSSRSVQEHSLLVP
jgi:tetratricopeptide (TPR) repeat protein